MDSLASADPILSMASKTVSLCGLALILLGGIGLLWIARRSRGIRVTGTANARPDFSAGVVLTRKRAVAAVRKDPAAFAQATKFVLANALIFAGGILLVLPQAVTDDRLAWTVFHVTGAAFFLILLAHALWAYRRARQLLTKNALTAAPTSGASQDHPTEASRPLR